jgi:hypothetical protein
MKGKKRIVDGELEGWYWARRSKPPYWILSQTTVWKQKMPRHVGAFDPPTSADQLKMKTSIISN